MHPSASRSSRHRVVRAFSLVGFAALVLLVCYRLFVAKQDRRVKALAQLAPGDALERLASLPIYSWRYRFQPTVPHIGPLAQDFYARFGLGDSPRRIYIVDAIGVAYAALIALYERVAALSEEWKRLKPLLERIAAEQAISNKEGDI